MDTFRVMKWLGIAVVGPVAFFTIARDSSPPIDWGIGSPTRSLCLSTNGELSLQ
jgi:hypothetical protein